MTGHEFKCLLGAIVALIIAAFASLFGRYLALLLCILAAALSLSMYRKARRLRRD